MDSVSRFMSEDHQLCDELLSSAVASVHEDSRGVAARRIQGYVDAMVKHFAMEEEVLFPAFEEHTRQAGDATVVMLGEHEQMRDLFRGLEEPLAFAFARSRPLPYLAAAVLLALATYRRAATVAARDRI